MSSLKTYSNCRSETFSSSSADTKDNCKHFKAIHEMIVPTRTYEKPDSGHSVHVAPESREKRLSEHTPQTNPVRQGTHEVPPKHWLGKEH